MGEDRITEFGYPVKMANGETWTLHALTLKQMREALPLLKKIQKFDANMDVSDPEVLDTLSKLAFSILKRTKPQLTQEEAEELIDLSNIKDIIDAGMGKINK